MEEQTEILFASQLGLQLSANKTEEMKFDVTSSNKMRVDRKEIKQIEKIIYLGSAVSIEDSTPKDIKSKNDLPQDKTFLEIKLIQQENKINLYNSNVKSVHLYGSKCWRITKTDMKSLSSFHHNCLKKSAKYFGQIPTQIQTY